MAVNLNAEPLVSIIVPVFNGERYLRESLDSILGQTYPRTEVLVMDDASTDDTPRIVASYGNNVRYRRQRENRGIYGNSNDGIAVARGELVAVYHADDVYLPTVVEREVRFLLDHPEVGVVFCKDIFIDPLGHECGRLELPPEVRGGRALSFPVLLDALLKYKNRFLRCPTAMVRASVYRDVGVYRDEEFRNSSDMEMWLRIARKYPVGILEEYLVRYRHFHDSSSSRYQRLRTVPERYFRIMDLYLQNGARDLVSREALAAHEAHRAEDHLMLAVNSYILDRRGEARENLRHLHPGRILASSRIERWRLFVLFLILKVLVHLPRIPLVAKLFYRRWHAEKYPKGASRGA